MPEPIGAALTALSAILLATVLAGLWMALRRAEKHEAWERTQAEARRSRLLSERKDVRALATYAPEMD